LQKGDEAPIRNFSKDIVDSSKYIRLLRAVCPNRIDQSLLDQAEAVDASTSDGKDRRAKLVLEFAETIECRRFVTASDIVSGHSRLNLAFTTEIFNKFIGIKLPSDEEIRKLYAQIEDLTGRNDALAASVLSKCKELDAAHTHHETSKKEWADRAARKELEMADRIDEILAKHTDALESQRSALQDQFAAQQSAAARVAAEREKELLAKIEALKQTQKQKLSLLEHKYAQSREETAVELGTVKKTLAEFLQKNGYEIIDEATPDAIEELPAQVKECVLKVLESHQDQTHAISALQLKLEHLNKINNVIGDKIQEYAENMITKDGKKKNHGSMFALFGGGGTGNKA
jgi:hypothetical protein